MHQAIDIRIGDWTPVSAAGEIGEIGASAGQGVMAGWVTAAENAAITF
jgi:hypothetical protein